MSCSLDIKTKKTLARAKTLSELEPYQLFELKKWMNEDFHNDPRAAYPSLLHQSNELAKDIYIKTVQSGYAFDWSYSQDIDTKPIHELDRHLFASPGKNTTEWILKLCYLIPKLQCETFRHKFKIQWKDAKWHTWLNGHPGSFLLGPYGDAGLNFYKFMYGIYDDWGEMYSPERRAKWNAMNDVQKSLIDFGCDISQFKDDNFARLKDTTNED